MTTNNSSVDNTWKHKQQVAKLMYKLIKRLMVKAISHDDSKLEDPEVEIFKAYETKLNGTTYGSDEYKQYLKEMKPALDHHYSVNRHHPEHFPGGIMDMNLIDILEMVCDWKASTMRHNDGNILTSIDKNQERFKYSDELSQIMKNTLELFED